MLSFIKKSIALDNPFRLFYHFSRAVIANIVYGFPSKNMTIIWITWTNWKTTTTNIVARSLIESWKKVFMFSTVNYIIWEKEFTNETKMSSPDPFYLQKLLYEAKKAWCEVAVIETTSHALVMHRNWGINYDVALLTNITQDHLDLHKTMRNYVDAKLKLFKNLIGFERKKGVKKTAIINVDSDYNEDFLDETYDNLYTYSLKKESNLRAFDIKNDVNNMTFSLKMPWNNLSISTKLRGKFNVYNIAAAIWVLTNFGIKPDKIEEIIPKVSGVPGRMEQVDNSLWFKVFVDYAHTVDAIENVLNTVRDIKWAGRIITVFWATWDRDKTKRPHMWESVSNLSDIVILTQDDDYSEDTYDIIKDVLPWINRKEWENFWIIADRENAIRTALIEAKKDDIVMILWKWDERIMMLNSWPVDWQDKAVIDKIIKEIEDNKIIK